MKIGIIGDIHADQNNIKETDIGMSNLLNVLYDHDVQWLLVTGDIFHDFNIGGKENSFGNVFDSINRPLNDFLKEKEKNSILMIPGNHDTPTDKNSKDALYSFDYRKNLHISRNIRSFNIGENVTIATLPWMWSTMYKDKNEILTRLKEIREVTKSNTNILIGHCEIEGSELPNGYAMFGGNFSFTKKELDSIGYDKIALGHIHKQQGYFTGTPWQHDFGESSLTGQVRIIDTNKKTDKFVEIPNTVKYYNINIENVDSFKCGKLDNVKVLGNKLDRRLPDGYKFQKMKENYSSVARSNVSGDETVNTLLGKWLKEKKIKTNIKDLTNILDKIDVPNSHICNGSLISFESVHIKGIGPHKDTYIEFKDPIIAITGSNGCGKTLLIESIFASLYGYLPSYGKIKDVSNERSSIETIFKVDEINKYVIIRKLNKNKQTAFLYKNGEKLVGPKISEVNKYIEKLIGPKELILSSIFSTQFYSGDIVELEPTDRKEIFHKLLGLNNLTSIKEKVDEKLKFSKAEKEKLSNQSDAVSTVEEIANNIKINKDAIEEVEGNIVKHEKKLEVSNSSLKSLNSAKNNYEKELTIKNGNEDKLVKVKNKIVELKELEKQYNNEIKENSSKKDTVELDLELRNKNKLLDSFNVQYKEQTKQLAELLILNNVVTEKQEIYNNWTLRIETIKNKNNDSLESIEKDTVLLKEVGCRDKPLPCKFIDSAKDNCGTLVKVQKEFMDGIKFAECERRVCKKDLDKSKKERDDYKVVEIDEDIYNTLNDEVKELRNKVESHNNSKLKLSECVTNLKNVSYNIVEKEKERDSINQYLLLFSDIKQEVVDKLEKSISVCNEDIKIFNDLITKYHVHKAKCIKELEFCKNEIISLTEYEYSIKELTKNITKLDILAEAFSKNGIPQLIIDSSLPQLQDIFNILTNYINKFSIKISTQKQQKESVKETIDFIVDDGIKPRDIKYYSGGEKKLLKSLIRLSLSLFQTQKTGKNYKVLFIDEVFDNLDKENSILLLKIIYNLSSRFNQIFIVSHSTDIINNLSSCIKLERNGERTIINVK